MGALAAGGNVLWSVKYSKIGLGCFRIENKETEDLTLTIISVSRRSKFNDVNQYKSEFYFALNSYYGYIVTS